MPTAFANRNPKGHVATVRGVDLSRTSDNVTRRVQHLIHLIPHPVNIAPMAHEATFENPQTNLGKWVPIVPGLNIPLGGQELLLIVKSLLKSNFLWLELSA